MWRPAPEMEPLSLPCPQVHRELSTLRQAVLDARHKYKGLMEEEADARQNLARQMRRALADLREEKRLLTEEVRGSPPFLFRARIG